MAQKIVDLDVVAGDPKKVRLAGHVYTLPPDLPVELYLRINRFAAESPDDDQIAMLYEQVLELFRYKDETVKELPIGLGSLFTVINTVYGSSTEETDPPTRGGTPSSSPSRTKRSRSSTS